MRHFCTYADHNYLPRAIALVDSLEKGGDFALWILALSQECEDILHRLRHPRIRIVTLHALEQADAELVATKTSRSTAEYIFTITPCWTAYLMKAQPEIDTLIYLDSDLYFFSSPEPIFREIGSASIGIIEHKHAKTKDQEKLYGRFNVGWVSFQRDTAGQACLGRWRSQCIEWCHDRAEDGKFADQKYLDAWPALFPEVCIIQHPGANLAPWNIAQYHLSGTPKRPTVDGKDVIFYHFSSMWAYSPWFVRLGLEDYLVEAPQRRRACHLIYQPYLRAINTATRHLRNAGFQGLPFNFPRHIDPRKFAGQELGSVLLQMKKRYTEYLKERFDGRVMYSPY